MSCSSRETEDGKDTSLRTQEKWNHSITSSGTRTQTKAAARTARAQTIEAKQSMSGNAQARTKMDDDRSISACVCKFATRFISRRARTKKENVSTT
mmetsp:Transcript_26393/g.73800  ORF Transcript_26393/g.73800 Transcript_26393/m.73800 type:complete len:96 (+) Transcript_26393:321-608(+)